MTVKEIAKAVMQLGTRAEITAVYNAAKRRDSQLRESAALNFVVGETVSFTGRRGVRVFGKVVKINRTTVGVVVNDVSWRVSPTLLRAETSIVPAKSA